MIRELLLAEHSKKQTLYIVKYIGKNKERIDELIKLFLSNETLIDARAAWVIHKIEEQHNGILRPYYSQLIQNLTISTIHDASKRNILRVLSKIENLNEDDTGLLIDLSFGFLIDNKEPIAVQVFAMECIYIHGKKYPEILLELKEIILAKIEFGSAGFKSRGKRILNGLKR